MSLKFIDDISAEIAALLPDNTSGQISPSDVRTVTQDILDSVWQRGGALIGDHIAAPQAQALTATPAPFPALWTSGLTVDSAIVDINPGAGQITLLQTGFIYEVSVSFACAGPNQADVRAALARNGVPATAIIAETQMTGSGEIKSVIATFPTINNTAGDTLTLLLSTPSGNATINFSQLVFSASLRPTKSAV